MYISLNKIKAFLSLQNALIDRAEQFERVNNTQVLFYRFENVAAFCFGFSERFRVYIVMIDRIIKQFTTQVAYRARHLLALFGIICYRAHKF